MNAHEDPHLVEDQLLMGRWLLTNPTCLCAAKDALIHMPPLPKQQGAVWKKPGEAGSNA